MKRLITLLAIATLFIGNLSAQNAYRQQGQISLDAGIGLSTSKTSGYRTVLPPIMVDGEYTILAANYGAIGVGLYANFSLHHTTDYDTSLLYGFTGIMGAYRYVLLENVDVFSKLILGYRFYSTSDAFMNSYLNDSLSHIGLGFYIGGTYYFSQNVGVGMSLGYGGPTTLGIQLTFKL